MRLCACMAVCLFSVPSYENYALMGYYAASSGCFLPTPDNRTDRLSRNIGNKLPLLAA